MKPFIIGIAVLGASVLAMYAVTLWKTWDWQQEGKNPVLKGLALPAGSIRGLVAFLIIGSFVIFIFFGAGALSTTIRETKTIGNPQTGETTTIETTLREEQPNRELYTAILVAFGTLTGAVTGFYFGSRSSQGDETKSAEPETGQQNTQTQG